MPRRSAMHSQPQRTLKRIVKQYGPDLVHDTRRTEALLRDLSGQHPREIFVLVNAQKQRIPAELLGAPSWLPYQAVHSRLTSQLQQRLAITEEAADWAVNAWAAALEIGPAPKRNLWDMVSKIMPISVNPSAGKSAEKTAGQPGRRQQQQSGVQSRGGVRRRAKRQRRADTQDEMQRQSSNRWFAWMHGMGMRLPAPNIALPGQFSVSLNFRFWHLWLLGAGVLLATIVVLTLLFFNPSIDGQTQSPTTDEPATQTMRQAEPQASASADDADAAIPYQIPVFDPRALLQQTYPTPRYANVSVDGLLVRNGPSTAYDYVYVLSLQEAVRVVGYGDGGEWSEIDQPLRGWVSNDYLTFQSPSGNVTVELGVRQVRTRNFPTVVRATPSSDAVEVARLPANQPVFVVAADTNSPDTWLQLAEPAEGWLSVHDTMWPTTP